MPPSPSGGGPGWGHAATARCAAGPHPHLPPEGEGARQERRRRHRDGDNGRERTRHRSRAGRLPEPALRLPPPPRPGRGPARAPPGGGGRRRPRGPGAGHRPRAAPGAGGAARQRQHPVDRIARDLLRQAHARGLRPAGLRRPHGRQGRVVEHRQGLFPRRAGLPLRPAARARPRAPGLHQPAAVLRRGLPGRARSPAAADRHPLEQQGHRHRAGRRWRHADRGNARGRVPPGRRLRERLRRLALEPAPAAGPGIEGPRVPRPLPDRRHHDGRAAADRAPLLVRPAVPSGPERAAAQAGRRHVAHRLPARIRGRREHPQLHARHRLHHAQERATPSRARWSTAAGCRCPRCCATRR